MISPLGAVLIVILLVLVVLGAWLLSRRLNDEREPWQRALDRKIAKEEKARRIKYKAESLLREQQEKEEYDRNVAILGSKYFCHCCGEKAKVPWSNYSDAQTENSTPHFEGYIWDHPADLKLCPKCHNWTCPKCLYRGICKKCAENL